MNPSIALIVLLVVLIFGAIAMGVCFFFLQRYLHPEPSPLEERLRRMRGLQVEDSAKGAVSEKSSRYYKGPQYQNEKLGLWLERFPQFNALRLRLSQADMKIKADAFIIRAVIAPLIAFPILGTMVHFPPVMFAGPALAVAAFFYVNMKRQKRYQKFVNQLPDGLMLITSALRAGHSLQSAMAVAAVELPDPIGAEFTILVKDINLGIPVKEALGRLVSKMDNMPDICMFATAVVIQREAGGNLAEVLETLGNTIRERFKLKRQISALTGQSRITGLIMGSAPFVMLLLLSVFMYSYVKPLYETDMGHIALGIAGFLQAIGFFVMRKIMDIRI